MSQQGPQNLLANDGVLAYTGMLLSLEGSGLVEHGIGYSDLPHVVHLRSESDLASLLFGKPELPGDGRGVGGNASGVFPSGRVPRAHGCADRCHRIVE